MDIMHLPFSIQKISSIHCLYPYIFIITVCACVCACAYSLSPPGCREHVYGMNLSLNSGNPILSLPVGPASYMGSGRDSGPAHCDVKRNRGSRWGRGYATQPSLTSCLSSSPLSLSLSLYLSLSYVPSHTLTCSITDSLTH